jgi:hypothetical protein
VNVQFRLQRLKPEGVNLHRRHLTETQRAAAGTKAKALYEQEAKERQKLSQGRNVIGRANRPHLLAKIVANQLPGHRNGDTTTLCSARGPAM